MLKSADLSDRVILVTGAGRGSGRLLARELGSRGAVIAANDISPINLEPVVDAINASGGHARAYIHDIAKKVDVQAMINNIVDDFGRIDILINCANVLLPANLLDVDEWDLHRIFEVNAIGTLLVIQSVARVMRTQSNPVGGIIINVLKTPAGAPASFLASRAGLAAMTDRINFEFAASGVRLFTVTDEDPVQAVLAICTEGKS